MLLSSARSAAWLPDHAVGIAIRPQLASRAFPSTARCEKSARLFVVDARGVLAAAASLVKGCGVVGSCRGRHFY